MRIAVAETYDVLITPEGDAYTFVAEAMDRSGFAAGSLAASPDAPISLPEPRPRGLLTMADMGMGHEGMEHGSPNHAGMEQEAMDHSGMDHSAMDHGDANQPAINQGMSHEAMNHDSMNHGEITSRQPQGAQMDRMAMDMSSGTPSNDLLAPPIGAPPGASVLSYADLRALEPNQDLRAPERTVIVRLGGTMERYIWTINGQKFDEAEPIELRYGERVRLTFINETMMNHPMHLHGMFVELDNGQPVDKQPRKHVVNVGPGRTYSVDLTANEPGEWAFHCHLMYHMSSGMMRKVVVARMADMGHSEHHGMTH